MRVMNAILVEDESLFRTLLHGALSADGTVQVIGAFASAQEALASPRVAQADVALLDIDLGPDGLDGIELGIRLREVNPSLGVALLSNHAHLAFARALIASSFTGWAYLLKKSVRDFKTVLRALDGVSRGEVVLDPQLVHAHSQVYATRFAHLTRRQVELWELITQGYSNVAIAQKLGLSQKWIDNAVGGLYQALNIDTHDGSINARVAAALLYAQEAQSAHLFRPDTHGHTSISGG